MGERLIRERGWELHYYSSGFRIDVLPPLEQLFLECVCKPRDAPSKIYRLLSLKQACDDSILLHHINDACFRSRGLDHSNSNSVSIIWVTLMDAFSCQSLRGFKNLLYEHRRRWKLKPSVKSFLFVWGVGSDKFHPLK